MDICKILLHTCFTTVMHPYGSLELIYDAYQPATHVALARLLHCS